ncbi:ASCH domain-containing protein [Haloplanus natans]|uniref:ASCH domain-containing protein n=1 Tax=Haloplanus natans TaxID=376171 RepID=UPI000A04EFDC|nr:ASCH domain-containing protein [Haloplanus natans]
MLFKNYHIPVIRSGSKTVTRREWADNYAGPNVGTVVAAKTDLLKPGAECDCFIRITETREEALGTITPASARREGDYDGVDEFIRGYEDVYGEGAWDPEKVVTVVEFEYVGRSRSREQAEVVMEEL